MNYLPLTHNVFVLNYMHQFISPLRHEKRTSLADQLRSSQCSHSIVPSGVSVQLRNEISTRTAHCQNDGLDCRQPGNMALAAAKPSCPQLLLFRTSHIINPNATVPLCTPLRIPGISNVAAHPVMVPGT